MIVIADDITGAAEIAGIAFEQGQEVRLFCSLEGSVSAFNSPSGCDTAAVTTVIATDTRSMSEHEAVMETVRIASTLQGQVIFKKTDSALRGHVMAELLALLSAGYRRAVYLPANPSKGRVIRQGIYYIQGVPLHETDFSFDPEFPASSSVLRERFPDAEQQGIIMPDAETQEDIRQVIKTYNDGETIFAGAADLFANILPPAGITRNAHPVPLTSESTLILCGSTQSKPLHIGIPIVPMPREVYDGKQTTDDWYPIVHQTWATTHSLILTIPHTHRTGKEIAVHLRSVMAEMTCRLVSTHRPSHLIIEGGATAWAILQALQWTRFQIEAQVAPGVVQMRADNGTLVTLKPGSYAWGGLMGSI